MSDIERLKKLRMLLDNDIITTEEVPPTHPLTYTHIHNRALRPLPSLTHHNAKYNERKLQIIAGGSGNDQSRGV